MRATYAVTSTSTLPNGTVSNTCGQAYLQPGGLVLLNVGPLVFGVGASAMIFTSLVSGSAFVAEGQLGARF